MINTLSGLNIKLIFLIIKKNLLSNWNITGYGEHGTESRTPESLTRAVDLALRDVGVNLVIKIEDNFEKLVKTMSTD